MNSKNYILSVVAIAIAVISLCVAIVRCEPIQAEWGAFMIATLGVLVAILIGWQIYSLIDLHSIRNEIDEKLSERLEVRLSDYDHEISGALDYIMGRITYQQCFMDDAVFHFAHGLQEQKQTKHPRYVKMLLRGLGQFKKDNLSPIISHSTKKLVLHSLSQLSTSEKYESEALVLFEFFSKIQPSDTLVRPYSA